MAGKFKSKELQGVYDTCLRLAADKTSELYVDGKPHRGASLRNAFWDGYEGIQAKHTIPVGTSAYAAYQAGRQYRRTPLEPNVEWPDA